MSEREAIRGAFARAGLDFYSVTPDVSPGCWHYDNGDLRVEFGPGADEHGVGPCGWDSMTYVPWLEDATQDWYETIDELARDIARSSLLVAGRTR